MSKENENIVKIPEEENDYFSDVSMFDIVSWGADLSFRELITMYDEGELAKPELQRKYVWDKTEASRFIDSLLLGLPIPSIFFARTEQETKLIIDGYQRIMTVYDYVNGIFSKDGSVFKLSRTDKVNKKWHGKTFKQLTSEEQRRILSSTIHTIIFEQRYPKERQQKDNSDKYDSSLYLVFERINTSGRTLLPQEIRNCIYHGRLNAFLIKANGYEKWRNLYGLKKVDSRMRDMEFILRFFALSSQSFRKHKKGQISLKKFLNDYMGAKENNTPETIKRMEEDFTVVIDFISDNFGINAFHNISSTDPNKYVERFHPTVFDSISIATFYALKKNKNLKIAEARAKRKKLLLNEEYKEYISTRTTNIESIKGRISLALKYLYSM